MNDATSDRILQLEQEKIELEKEIDDLKQRNDRLQKDVVFLMSLVRNKTNTEGRSRNANVHDIEAG